ncbi:MAG: hypothetical protein RL115_1282 [Bacteroidota bacterium]
MQNTLKKITDSLLSTTLSYLDIRNNCIALSELFCSITQFDEHATTHQQHVLTTAGEAVSPVTAMRCVTDMMRTKQFLCGINKAIENKLKEKNEAPVVVFYAGTGPFATLLTPLTTRYTPAQLQLVLLEINPISISYLKLLIKELGIADYVKGMIEADATNYLIPTTYQPDILVSETMKEALKKEPQLNIVANLMPQCGENCILIPEEIKINASLAANLATCTKPDTLLQTLLILNKTVARQLKANAPSIPVINDGLIITIQEIAPHQQLILDTAIKVYENFELGFRESSLTCPVLLDSKMLVKCPARLRITYQLVDKIGFNIEIL